MTRALRRAADLRAKARVKAWMIHQRWPMPTARDLGLYASTPARCSCSMCGHYRRNMGPSFSEIRRLVAAEVAA